jgi:hypothetical protein
LTWRVEKDPESTAWLTRGPEEVTLQYHLRPGSRASQFVALAADIPGRLARARRIDFEASAAQPMRISVQLRYASGGGERWTHSAFVGTEPRQVAIPIAAMLPADHQPGPPPDPASARSLLLVVDLTNALPGAANTIRISKIGYEE